MAVFLALQEVFHFIYLVQFQFISIHARKNIGLKLALICIVTVLRL